jgi:pimeloyl-ACP methyl ester carboxylesterase
MTASKIVLFASLLCAAIQTGAAETQKQVSEPVFHGEVHYRVSGPETAPTVMLVHGLGDKASNEWDGVVADLARDYRVVRFDLPGFGQSSKGNHAYTPDNYAKLLRALVDRESRARPFFLVGHSMGGAIALRYAALYPRDIKALVLVDVPAILHRSVYTRHMVAFGLSGLVPGLNLNDNEFLNSKMGSVIGKLEKRPLPVELAVQLSPLRQKLLKGEPAKIAGLALALEDFSRDIERVLAPTLVVWGERDLIAPVRNGRVLAANLAQARLEVLPNSGHVPMDDVPSLFQKQLRDFLVQPVIADRYIAVRDETALPASTRRGRCEDQRGQVFEGDYERIDILRCDGAILRDVRARTVKVVNSKVTIEDSRIGDGGGGLTAEGSRLSITSSRLEGNPAIRASDSKLDIAGSRLIGKKAAVTSPALAEIACSVCQVESPALHGPLHGLRAVTPELPL